MSTSTRDIDRLTLTRVHLDLSRPRFERRLTWLCQNVGAAIDIELEKNVPRSWLRDAHRTALLIELFLESTVPPSDTAAAVWDVLDATIRSKKTADKIRAAPSGPWRKWHIITSLKPEDFAQALRAVRVTGSRLDTKRPPR